MVMDLDLSFYQNLFQTLSQQAKTTPTFIRGWASNENLLALMKRLQEDANARHIFIIERTGKQSASYGDLGNIDITDLLALVVGKTLACDALAETVQQPIFTATSIEGKQWGAHLSPLGTQAILMVIFDYQTNVDRVGQRVRKSAGELAAAILSIDQQATN